MVHGRDADARRRFGTSRLWTEKMSRDVDRAQSSGYGFLEVPRPALQTSSFQDGSLLSRSLHQEELVSAAGTEEACPSSSGSLTNGEDKIYFCLGLRPCIDR